MFPSSKVRFSVFLDVICLFVCPNLQDLNNRVLKGKELQQQILGSENEKEGGKTKILFKPHLFNGNGGGGFLKLKIANEICSGTQAKPVVLGNTLRSKEYRHCKKGPERSVLVVKCPKSIKERKQDSGGSKRVLDNGP